MKKRSKKRWLDIRIILTSIAVTFTVGLWNVFARGNNPVVAPSEKQPPNPTYTLTLIPNPTATSIPTVDPNAPVHLPQVHLLLGGKMYIPPPVVAAAQPSGGNSGDQSSSQNTSYVGNAPVPAAPVPLTNTSSSKP